MHKFNNILIKNTRELALINWLIKMCNWPTMDKFTESKRQARLTWSRWSRCVVVTVVDWDTSDKFVSLWPTPASMSSSVSLSLSNVWRQHSRSPTNLVTPTRSQRHTFYCHALPSSMAQVWPRALVRRDILLYVGAIQWHAHPVTSKSYRYCTQLNYCTTAVPHSQCHMSNNSDGDDDDEHNYNDNYSITWHD